MTKNLTTEKPKAVKVAVLRTRLKKWYLLLGLGLAAFTPIAHDTEASAISNLNALKSDCIGIIAGSTVNSAWQPVASTSLLPVQLTKRVLNLMLQTIVRTA